MDRNVCTYRLKKVLDRLDTAEKNARKESCIEAACCFTGMSSDSIWADFRLKLSLSLGFVRTVRTILPTDICCQDFSMVACDAQRCVNRS